MALGKDPRIWWRHGRRLRRMIAAQWARPPGPIDRQSCRHGAMTMTRATYIARVCFRACVVTALMVAGGYAYHMAAGTTGDFTASAWFTLVASLATQIRYPSQ